MNKPVKKKLCWNCEGSVSKSIENCPYCGVYLSPDTNEDNFSSKILFQPPYTPEASNKEFEIPKAPYQPQVKEEPENPLKEQALSLKAQVLPLKNIYLSVLFLSAGALALFFSLLLLFFSHEGKLILEWDGDLWYFYTIFALPLLFMGWKSLERLDKL